MDDFDFFEPNPLAEDIVSTQFPARDKYKNEYEKSFLERAAHNKKVIVGIVLLFFIFLLTFLNPIFNPHTYSDQDVRFTNVPPILRITKVAPGSYIHVNSALHVINVSEDGHLLSSPEGILNTSAMGFFYNIDGKSVSVKLDKNKKIVVFVDGKQVPAKDEKTVWNKSYWLGTDSLGRDMLARVFYGTRISLYVGIFSALIASIFGSIYGGIAGYSGRRLGELMMRVIDIIDSIPLILIVILLMMIISPSLKTVVLTMGMIYWTSVARQVRGQILSLKEREFILAARVLGVPKHKIIFKHLIPNSIVQIIIAMTVDVPTAIFSEAFLSFLGLGVRIPKASLGSLTSDAIDCIRIFPYQVFIPGLAIALIVYSFNVLGDGMQQILNPEKKYIN